MRAADVMRMIATRRTGLTAAAVVTCAAVGLLVAAQVGCLATGVEMEVLTRDPAALLKARPYVGILSTLGIGCWGAATGVGVLGWLALRSGDPHQRELSGALRAFALLSAWLGVDDLAQLHEHAPRLLGVSEAVVYLAYAALAVAWVLWYRRVLLEGAPLPLLIAIAGLGGSVLADEFGNLWFELPLVLEDGFKLVGIANWAAWAGVVVWSELEVVSRVASPAEDPEPIPGASGLAHELPLAGEYRHVLLEGQPARLERLHVDD